MLFSYNRPQSHRPERLQQASPRPSSRILATCSLWLALLAAPTLAASIVVDSPAWGDDGDNSTCTVWEAVMTAKDPAFDGGCQWGGESRVELQLDATYLTEGHFPKVAGALVVLGNGATLQMVNETDDEHFFKVKVGASLELYDLTLAGGRSWRGGAVKVFANGIFQATRVTFRDNHATDLGGAIFSRGHTVLTRCTLEQNSAFDGGAIATIEGSLSVVRSLLVGNVATDRGGALLQASIASPVVLDKSTFSANQGSRGGAIFKETGTSSAATEVYQSTFVGNSATTQDSGSVLYLEPAAALTLAKSALHVSTSGEPLCAGYLTGLSSLGNNAATDASCQLTTASDQPAANFSFSELVDHGGFTRIHAPLCDAPPGSGAPCSILIDQYPCQALNVEGEDQRGFRRADTYGGLLDASSCDIGAYESLCEAGTLMGSTLVVFLIADQYQLDGTLFNSGACAGMTHQAPVIESPPASGCQVKWHIYGGSTLGIEAIWFLEDTCQEDCFVDPAACQQNCTPDPTDWLAGLPLGLELPSNPQPAGSSYLILDAPSCEVEAQRYVIELANGTVQYWDPLLEIETGDGGP